MSVKLLTEHHLEFLSLKGGCTGSSESTIVKMPHCWKSHATAQIMIKSFFSELMKVTTQVSSMVSLSLFLLFLLCVHEYSSFHLSEMGIVVRKPDFVACEKQRVPTSLPTYTV